MATITAVVIYVWISCGRCQGSGNYLHFGACFRCNGAGEIRTTQAQIDRDRASRDAEAERWTEGARQVAATRETMIARIDWTGSRFCNYCSGSCVNCINGRVPDPNRNREVCDWFAYHS